MAEESGFGGASIVTEGGATRVWTALRMSLVVMWKSLRRPGVSTLS